MSGRTFAPMNGQDLEAIVTLLELAAIYLTPEPFTLFTFEELYEKAKEIGGPEITLDERDVRIVVSSANFLRRQGSQYYLR